MTRVLIADDSATVRSALRALLSAEEGIEIVGEAADGLEAVALARALRPDVITMDVDMPRLDGLSAIAAIMAETPSRILVIASVGEQRQMELSFRAMAAGALEVIAKSQGGDLRAWGRKVSEAVRLMAEVPVVRRQSSGPRPSPLLPLPEGDVDVFGIVASTGGPPALARVLGALPSDLPIPLLIAQHIAEGFTAGLISWFSGVCGLRIRVAEPGRTPLAGHVYFAPDGCDLEVDAQGVLRTPRPDGLHTPSGNRLLTSLADAHGARAGGAVLTGMGDDGAQGLLALRQRGAPTFAQDESSSVVFGMPQAAIAAGAARSLVSLEGLAAAILDLCKGRK